MIPFEGGVLRPWRPEDAESVAENANSRRARRTAVSGSPPLACPRLRFCRVPAHLPKHTTLTRPAAAATRAGGLNTQTQNPTRARRAVWLNCSDRFAHPYTRADADAWIAACLSADGPGAPASQLAIEIGGAAAGGIGIFHRDGVQRRTKELGYWLGEAHWGRGLGGRVVAAFLPHVWSAFPEAVGPGGAAQRRAAPRAVLVGLSADLP